MTGDHAPGAGRSPRSAGSSPRPLLLSTSDGGGGAAIAAHRLHRGLRAIGVDSEMLVQRKRTGDRAVHGPASGVGLKVADWRARLNKLPLPMLGLPARTPFSLQWIPDRLASVVDRIDPDVVHLHWVCGGFMQVETLGRFRRPVVWTLHDMWPFTGGCHYGGSCRRFERTCGRCPVLGSRRENDLSRRVWGRKHAAWEGADVTIVSPSGWLADEARSSALFADRRIEVIANGIDTSVFRPRDTDAARRRFGLPPEGSVVLFGAMQADTDPRKGYPLLRRALQLAVGRGLSDTRLAVLGASGAGAFDEVGVDVHYLPSTTGDEAMADAYSAADVFVSPSTQENLSNMVVEALACGTPTVAFRIGGMPDMIEHQRNGYLAAALDPEDLAAGILWVLDGGGRAGPLGRAARSKAERDYDAAGQAGRYRALYEELHRSAPKDPGTEGRSRWGGRR